MVRCVIPDISVVDLAFFGQHYESNGVALALVL
jgi:hypothetical protein